VVVAPDLKSVRERWVEILRWSLLEFVGRRRGSEWDW